MGRQRVGWKGEQLTLGCLLAVFHRFEVDGGEGTDHLHGFSFHQTGGHLAPTSPLQEQTSDIYSILLGGGVIAKTNTFGRVKDGVGIQLLWTVHMMRER